MSESFDQNMPPTEIIYPEEHTSQQMCDLTLLTGREIKMLRIFLAAMTAEDDSEDRGVGEPQHRAAPADYWGESLVQDRPDNGRFPTIQAGVEEAIQQRLSTEQDSGGIQDAILQPTGEEHPSFTDLVDAGIFSEIRAQEAYRNALKSCGTGAEKWLYRLGFWNREQMRQDWGHLVNQEFKKALES